MKTFALGCMGMLCLALAAPVGAQPLPIVGRQFVPDEATMYFYFLTDDGNVYRDTATGIGDAATQPFFNFWGGIGLPTGPLAYRVAVESGQNLHLVMLANGDTYERGDTPGTTATHLGNFWAGTGIVPTADFLAGFTGGPDRG